MSLGVERQQENKNKRLTQNAWSANENNVHRGDAGDSARDVCVATERVARKIFLRKAVDMWLVMLSRRW